MQRRRWLTSAHFASQIYELFADKSAGSVVEDLVQMSMSQKSHLVTDHQHLW